MAPETRQQIIALVLGLIFIVGFVLFAQRLGQFLRDRQQKTKSAVISISPTPSVPVLPSPVSPIVIKTTDGKQPDTSRRGPTAIPSTGPEMSLFAGLSALLGGGYLLRRFSYKV